MKPWVLYGFHLLLVIAVSLDAGVAASMAVVHAWTLGRMARDKEMLKTMSRFLLVDIDKNEVIHPSGNGGEEFHAIYIVTNRRVWTGLSKRGVEIATATAAEEAAMEKDTEVALEVMRGRWGIEKGEA